MLGGLSVQGLIAPLRIRGSVDGEGFRAYVEQVLVPALRPGQVVVWDNLKAHKVAGIEEAITAVGGRVLPLPPYSPDFSPIEPCWSKVKAYLRTAAARTYQVLDRAMPRAINQVTAQDAQGWFHHCGYSIASN